MEIIKKYKVGKIQHVIERTSGIDSSFNGSNYLLHITYKIKFPNKLFATTYHKIISGRNLPGYDLNSLEVVDDEVILNYISSITSNKEIFRNLINECIRKSVNEYYRKIEKNKRIEMMLKTFDKVKIR